MSESSPRTLIIVLTYNGIDLTRACLQSLRGLRNQAYSILVVDNASSDATVAHVQEEFPEVAVLANESNLGFAAGNNRGLEYALAQGYDYALLLNNDTEVSPDFLDVLVRRMEDDTQLGAVGPLIYYAAEPDRIWSAGGIVDSATGSTSMRALDVVDEGQYQGFVETDFITGCALLVRCALLQDVGLIDERFFMYYEETEWCARMRQAGWTLGVAQDAHIWHKIQPSGQPVSPRVLYYMTRNRLLYLRLTRAPASAWLHAALLQDWRTWLSWRIRPKWRDRGAARNAIARGWQDYLRGRFGMAAL